MNEIDELSRALGRIEGELEAIKISQTSQWSKLDKIERYIVSHKMMTAGIAGSISMLGTFLVFILNKWFGGK